MHEKNMTLVEDDLAGLKLSDGDAQYLLQNGLPVVDEENPPVGVVFTKPSVVESSGNSYQVFGREVWGDDLFLCVDAASGTVFANAAEADEKDVYVNASIVEFFAFYRQVAPLWVRCDEMDDISHSGTFTDAEVAQSIAALQQWHVDHPGESLNPAEDELDRDIKKTKSALKKIDKKALKGKSWWGRIIEEMEV